LSRSVATYIADGAPAPIDSWPWKNRALPAIHMPRGVSRISLLLEEVSVEKLSDITEADAIAEGIVEAHRDRPAALGDGKTWTWPDHDKWYVDPRAEAAGGYRLALNELRRAVLQAADIQLTSAAKATGETT
jgi:hypothetical protein